MRSAKGFTACAAALALLVSACGDGGGTPTPTPTPTGTPTPTPTPPPVGGCSLRERQDWAEAQLREWYLFPETLPATSSPAAYATLDDYIYALTETARAQNRDRYFTYRTSIAEENAFYASGSSAGMGVRLGADYTEHRLFVIESFETGPASAAGIRRGTEIVAIGTNSGNMQTVQSIWAAGDVDAVSAALGPEEDGVTRVLQISDANGTRTVTVAKRDFDLQPVSSDYGYRIVPSNGRNVGYLNLRAFLGSADGQLRTAFAAFRDANVRELVIDLRYNSGGAILIAELMGSLLGADRAASDVFIRSVFRPEKSEEDTTAYFERQPESIAARRIAFITTGQSASASEMVISGMLPYLDADIALIGSNTYGKPVGQIAIDRAQCDDRLRVVALKVENSRRESDYFNGLGDMVTNTCTAYDDIGYEMGDVNEDSTATALRWLNGGGCEPFAGTGARMARKSSRPAREVLVPARPSAAQREVPGLF